MRTEDGWDPEDGSAAAPAAAEPPRVEGWTARALIGEGAQAEVWLVRSPQGEEAVLKVARAGEDPAAVAAEAEAYGHLHHPHLLRVLGTVSTDRGTGVLTERLPAGNLGSMVQDAGPLRPGQAVTVLVPVAQALAHLHAHGVVHGDVAPGNVLFAVDGRPALSDLGVARVVGGPRGRGGTPGFLAPERRDGDQGARAGDGAAADVYAWAALGWYALTGRAPGAREHRAPLPVLVPDVPVELALLLDAALDPDPARRPSAADAAVAAYDAAAPEPVPLHDSAPPEVAHLLPTLIPPERAAGAAHGARPRRGGSRRARTSADAVRGDGRRVGRVGTDGGRRSGRPGRRVALLALAGVVVAGLASGAALLSRGEPGPEAPGIAAPAAPTATPTASSDPTGPTPTPAPRAEGTAAAAPTAVPAGDALQDLLDGLAEARTAALADPRPERLSAYAAADGPAWRRDRSIQEELDAGGYAFSGLAVGLVADGAASPAGPDRLRVPARLTLSAHTVLDEAGAPVDQVPGSDEGVVLTLVRGGDRWLVHGVDPR